MKLINVVLPTCAGAGGCGCSISINARRVTVASRPFSNAETILHSAADATIFFRILHRLCIGPLSFGWYLDESSMK